MKTGILLIHCVSTSHDWSLVTELPTDGGFTARMASEKPTISRGALLQFCFIQLFQVAFSGGHSSVACALLSLAAASCQLARDGHPPHLDIPVLHTDISLPKRPWNV